MAIQTWFSLLLLFEIFVTLSLYLSYIDQIADILAFIQYFLYEFMLFHVNVFCHPQPQGWAPDPLKDDTPFYQKYVGHTINWKLFRFTKATEGNLR